MIRVRLFVDDGGGFFSARVTVVQNKHAGQTAAAIALKSVQVWQGKVNF